jgi:anti-anti-sigma factor
VTEELVKLQIEERGDVIVAHVAGELDIAGASRTGERIAERVPTSARLLVVDFSELEFIDSSGVAMLFGLARRLGSRRQELRVVAPGGDAVGRVLEIVEFDRAAPIFTDLDEAIAGAGSDGA